jgi:predicted outer membrane repeat protein
VTITNSTFSGNSAGFSGGAIASSGTLTLKNTIVANSTSGGDCSNFGTVSPSNNNLIEDSTNACGLTNGVNGNIIGSDPNLGALTGSPAYFPLNPGSLAIDAGDNATCAAAPVNNTSQNGVTRPQGPNCDIGSYEVPYTLGDVNDDGKINTLDARMAQQHADGVITLTGNQFLAADVDTDSDVDSTDATAIAKKGIGLPTGIPGFATTYPLAPSLKGRGDSPPTSGEGLGERSALWLAFSLLPALLLVRRTRRVAMLLLTLGLVGTLTGCVEFAGLPPPGGPAIFLTSTSMPNGATRTIEIAVQQITAQGGVASLQGRITYPSGVASSR